MSNRISVKEAASRLGMSLTAIRNRMQSGELPIGMMHVNKNHKGEITRRTFVIYEDLVEEARRGKRRKEIC